MYIDQNGLIVQQNGDGGDTLQRIGFWFEGIYFSKDPQLKAIMGSSIFDYINLLHKCEVYPFEYIRNPINYNDPKDTSRDQLVSNIRASGYFKTYIPMGIEKRVLSNWSRYPNRDYAFLQDYGRFARAMGHWWSYPLILLGDIFLLGNSLIRIIKGRNPDDVGDDINHIGDLQQAKTIYPTPISWLARKLYKWFRPFGIEYPLQWYFRAASGANTEFIDLWIPIIKEF